MRWVVAGGGRVGVEPVGGWAVDRPGAVGVRGMEWAWSSERCGVIRPASLGVEAGWAWSFEGCRVDLPPSLGGGEVDWPLSLGGGGVDWSLSRGGGRVDWSLPRGGGGVDRPQLVGKRGADWSGWFEEVGAD